VPRESTPPALPALALPALPRDGDEPVFAEPWEAQAFALTLKLHEAGHFTWSEWATTLGAEIEAARLRGDPDLGDTYYQHWLAALERLAAEKGLVGGDELGARKTAWKRAFLNTPHGQPILLEAGEKNA